MQLLLDIVKTISSVFVFAHNVHVGTLLTLTSAFDLGGDLPVSIVNAKVQYLDYRTHVPTHVAED